MIWLSAATVGEAAYILYTYGHMPHRLLGTAFVGLADIDDWSITYKHEEATKGTFNRYWYQLFRQVAHELVIFRPKLVL